MTFGEIITLALALMAAMIGLSFLQQRPAQSNNEHVDEEITDWDVAQLEALAQLRREAAKAEAERRAKLPPPPPPEPKWTEEDSDRIRQEDREWKKTLLQRFGSEKLGIEPAEKPAPVSTVKTDDLVSALVNMGFKAKTATKAVEAAKTAKPDGDFNELFKMALTGCKEG